jgi:hypothetical protein
MFSIWIFDYDLSKDFISSTLMVLISHWLEFLSKNILKHIYHIIIKENIDGSGF